MSPTLLLLTTLAHGTEPPSPAQGAMYQALSARDQTASCDELAALSQAPAKDLIWLVDHAAHPPWVGMRAAQCILLHHADTELDTLTTWVTSPEYKGLAILTLSTLDQLSAPTQEHLSKAALTGPHADEATRRLGLDEATLPNETPAPAEPETPTP